MEEKHTVNDPHKKTRELLDKWVTMKKEKDRQVNIRLTEEQYAEMTVRANVLGFVSMSEYLRFAGLNIKVKIEEVVTGK